MSPRRSDRPRTAAANAQNALNAGLPDPDRVDRDIDAAERREVLLDRGLVERIDLRCGRTTAELLGQCLERFAMTTCERDGRARLSESPRERVADGAAGSVLMEDPRSAADHALATRAALRTFMHLRVAQRQVVILMDVLGYSLDEIASLTDRTIASIKAALHRGRASLRELVDAERSPRLDVATDARLLAYVDRFNARDFDAVRDMLAEDVHLDLVAKRQMNGKSEVETYFSNYATRTDWHLVPGFVEGQPAVTVVDPATPVRVAYFVLLAWNERGQLATVRDFRYARYAIDGADHTAAAT